MKEISFIISLFLICSCAKDPVLNKQKLSSSSPQSLPTPKVYFKKTNQFVDITRLNRKHKNLDLYDKIIFSPEKTSFNRKDGDSFKLKPLNSFRNKTDIKMKIASVCSIAKIDLKKTNRLFEERASSYLHPHFSIIDLIPKEFLLNHLDKELYCSFIFSIRNKQKKLTHYSLTQQVIQADFSRAGPLSLIQKTDSGHIYAPAGHIIDNKNIQTALLLNNTEQPVSSYEMFCEGIKVMSAPNFKTNMSNVFLNLKHSENWPDGLKSCRLFSKNKDKITGATRSFKLNFDSLNINNKAIDLSLIEEPVFINTSKNNIDTSKIATGFLQMNRRRNEYMRHTYLPKAQDKSLALNAYIYFNGLNKLKLYKNFNPIEMILETQCFETYINENIEGHSLFAPHEAITTTVRIPLKEKTPIAIALPHTIFDMGKNYDTWLRNLIKTQTIIDGRERDLKREKDYNEKSKKLILYHDTKFTAELILKKLKNQVTCLYKIKLADKTNHQNYKEFEAKAYKILWTRASYGVSHKAISKTEDLYGGKNKTPAKLRTPFVTEQQQAYRRAYEAFPYESIIGYISLNFFDLPKASSLKKKSQEIEMFALRCNSPASDQNLYLSSLYHLPENNKIYLKDIFSHHYFQSYIESQKIVSCRLLFYGTGGLLRYFSREIRLHDIHKTETDFVKSYRVIPIK